MAEHSIVPPSSAGVTLHCPGSVLMRLTYPETEETADSRIGTATHELAAKMIESAAVANLGYPTKAATVDTLASNGELITEEMYEGAEIYAQEVARIMREHAAFNPAVEEKVECPDIHPLSWGTPDCYLFLINQSTLIIWDFKFGHRYISEFENWQLINYFSGIFRKLNLEKLGDENITVKLGVIQPRAYGRGGPIRYWTIKASDLRGYINRLHHATHKALNGAGDVEYVTGSHCYQCPGLHACSAAREAGLGLYEVATRGLPEPMPPEAIGVQLQIVRRAIEQLQFLETALEEQVGVLLRTGKDAGPYKLEQAYGRLNWTATKAEVTAAAEKAGVEVTKETLITPTQAKKAGFPAEEINKLADREMKGLKVVEIDLSKAKRIFNHGN